MLYQGTDSWEARFGEQDALEARLQMKAADDMASRGSYDGPVFFDTSFKHRSHESDERAHDIIYSLRQSLDENGYELDAEQASVQLEQRVWEARCVSDSVRTVPGIRGVMHDMVEAVRSSAPRYASKALRESTYPYGQRDITRLFRYQ
jgi:hypothetical protein